jgi:hypothetical protein
MFVSRNPKYNAVANSNEIITWFYNRTLVEKSDETWLHGTDMTQWLALLVAI